MRGYAVFSVVAVLARLIALGFSVLIALGLFGFATFGQVWRSGFWSVLGIIVVTGIFYLAFQAVGAILTRTFRSSR